MKKSILIFALLIALAGCSSQTTSGGTTSPAPSEQTATPTATQTAAPTQTEAAPANKADFGDFTAEIVDCAFTKDYNNKNVIVINMNYVNNLDEAKAFIWQSQTKAFQNGVELETAIVSKSEVYDSGLSQKDVKKGVPLAVQSAFVLDGSSAPVEVEVTKLIDYNSKTKAVKTFNVQ